MISESLVGFGKTYEEAVINGLEYFSQNILHVLLTKLWEYPENEQCEQVKWELNDHLWDVVIGDITTRTFGDHTPSIPQNIVSVVEEILKDETLTEERYWIRIFYSSLPDGESTVEVLLNNLPWENGIKAVESLDWENQEYFYSTRLFMILEKEEPSNKTIHEFEAIDALYEIVNSRDEFDEDFLYGHLIENGFDEPIALHATNFVPVALGRKLLDGIGITFSPDYLIFDKHGRKIEHCDIESNPYYTSANLLSWKLNENKFKELSFISAEVNAVNNALNNDSKPEELVLFPPIFFTEEPTDYGYEQVQHYLNNLTATPPQSPENIEEEPVECRKPWWKFW